MSQDPELRHKILLNAAQAHAFQHIGFLLGCVFAFILLSGMFR